MCRSIASEIRRYVPQLLAVHRFPCDSLEHMPCHAECKLILSHEHLPGLLFPEQRCLFVAMGAHDRFHVRFERARDFDHFPRSECIRDGDHQHLRPGDMRLNEHRGVGGIPGDSWYTAFTQPLDELTVLLSHNDWYAALGQRFTDAPADAAIAYENDMPIKAILVDVHRKLR